jgi:competence protein ComEC
VVALLPGDIEAAQEAALVQAGLSPVHWLLVPHHGSKTSSTEPFLQALQPRLALVQAGYRNRYGHPAPPVLARYRDQGIPLVESTAVVPPLGKAPPPKRCDVSGWNLCAIGTMLWR